MNAQRRDLARSRSKLEAAGESFGCFRCGAALPPVNRGHTSDLCAPCDARLEREDAQAWTR